MRIYFFILALFALNANAQINAYNIRIGSDKDQDSIYCLLTATTGSNFAGRGEFKSLPQLAALLDDYIAGTGGTSDGDKGDVTVIGGVWTIDNNAITNGKILNDAVDHNKIATDAVRAAEIQAGAVGASELLSSGVTPVWYRDTPESTGGFSVRFDGITSTNVFVIMPQFELNNQYAFDFGYGLEAGNLVVSFHTKDAGSNGGVIPYDLINGAFIDTPIEIRIYP